MRNSLTLEGNVNNTKLICKVCDREAQEEKKGHADKYSCPKCNLSAYHQANGTWLMLKRTNGGRVFGLIAHSEIEILSTDMSDSDFPFRTK